MAQTSQADIARVDNIHDPTGGDTEYTTGVDAENTYKTTETDMETYSKNDTSGPQEQHMTHEEQQNDEPTIQGKEIVEEMNPKNIPRNKFRSRRTKCDKYST